jgi:hypothetical protein
VTALVLLCQAMAWVHEATPHVTCFEHGERVHLPVVRRAPDRTTAGELAVVAETESGADGHEHCGLQGQRTDAAATPAVDSSLAIFTPTPQPPISQAGPSLRLLRLAPKTSPPPTPAA